MSQRFGPDARLRHRREFKALDSGGRRLSGRFFTLIGKPNGGPQDRLGIVASRRVGNAIARNRAKRRLRELFRRRNPQDQERHLDVVAIAKADMVDAPFQTIQADFLAALAKLRGVRS